jgi:peptidylprolyl isomerase
MSPRSLVIGFGCIFGFAAAALTVVSLTMDTPITASDKKEDAPKDKGTPNPDDKDVVTTKSGLKYVDRKVGDGDEAKAGATVKVHYTGTLENGKKFDSSVDRGQPFSFKLGVGQVIKGWDEGVAGMKIGGKRKLIIPSELGYGARGAGASIPPDSVLIFEVELLGVSK